MREPAAIRPRRTWVTSAADNTSGLVSASARRASPSFEASCPQPPHPPHPPRSAAKMIAQTHENTAFFALQPIDAPCLFLHSDRPTQLPRAPRVRARL